MSGKSVHPRPMQIAALTEGHSLPMDPISPVHMKIIADCLAQAWNGLVNAYPGQLPADEVELNSLMRSQLNNLSNPLWKTLVSSVTLDASVCSFDGSHLQKSPDLSIHLTRRHPNFHLEVECKLIDHPKRKPVDLYAQEGLARFLRGEYAWGTREAFMLAYVWDGSTVHNCLTPFLMGHQQSGSDPYNTNQIPSSIGARTNLACSYHARNFAYPQQSSSSPGPIVIWHLWL
jgi:hypothetical protein